ncbi:hypothetical protein EW146_g6361 [Bondarzewia mesenterica]|uniref:Major facilitator superfamily (MFS) profile domain-containing protein n=1 Tax=Bondarzewia mesenterica TaxID=1095465 RepID=A0A4S4LNQ9_9AGAM|nr:hypothetical protein EW146_g6361 [Bondarzewia mesenterica]
MLGQSSSTNPIRAITSKISARSAAPVPPATQTYEPLVRNVLRHRLLSGTFLSSAILTWVLTTFWAAWYRGRSQLGITTIPFLPFLPSTLLLTALAWAFGIVPVVVMRKVQLTATPSAASSPSQTFKSAFSKPSTLHALATYMFSATCFTALHIVSAYASEAPNSRGDHPLAVFVKSRKHPYYFNGRFLFLVFAQIALAVGFHTRSIMLDRLAVHWQSTRILPFRTTFATPQTYHAALAGLTALVFTPLVLSAYTVAFGLVRSLALPVLLRLPGVSMILRPFYAHFLRGSWTIVLFLRHWPLLCRSSFLGLSIVTSWDFTERLFDEKVQEPVLVAHQTPDPSATLVSAVTSSDVYYKYFAFYELKKLAEEDSSAASARRTALFGDQKYNPSLWSTLLRESLLFLGKDYQLLLRRGQPAPPPAAPVPLKPKNPEPPSTPLIRKAIFKAPESTPVRSVIDSIAADGAITQVVQSTVQMTTAHLPELFKAIESPAAAVKQPLALITTEAPAKVVTAPACGANAVKHALHAFIPSSLVRLWEQCGDWWRRERINKAAEASLPYRQVDVLAVEVLSHLVCASLTEDRYGVVQRDIPRILEAMLSYLTAIEEYQTELSARAPPPSSDEELLPPMEREARARVRLEVAHAGDVLAVVGDDTAAGPVGRRLSVLDEEIVHDEAEIEKYGGDEPDEPTPKTSLPVAPPQPPADPNLVTWDGPNDPENPQNWSRRRKWALTVLVSLLTLNVTFASSAPSSGTLFVAAEFGISSEVSYLITSIFLIGYVLGPCVWGPGSEVLGRKPVFIFPLIIYTIFHIGQALAHNIQTLLVTRFLSGFFACSPLVIGGGFIADVWDPVGRGPATTMFATTVALGPVMGPVVSGFIVESYLGWRWVFWVMMMFAGACTALAILFMPETFAPVLLHKKAKRLRKADPVANKDLYAELEKHKFSLSQLASRTISRPFKMMAMEPILVLVTIYLSIVYGVIYALFEAFPVTFIGKHGLTLSQDGLIFIGAGIGTTVGAFFNLYLSKSYPMLMKEWRGFPPPEKRLYGAMFGGPALVIGIFWLGWTGEYSSVPWYVPAISTIVIGFAITLIFMSFLNYLVDTYLMYSASAFAANTMCRSAVGAAFPLFTVQMFEGMHINWASTLIGCVGLLLAPMPFLFYKYGTRIRQKSKFAPCIDLKIAKLIEAERKAASEKGPSQV